VFAFARAADVLRVPGSCSPRLRHDDVGVRLYLSQGGMQGVENIARGFTTHGMSSAPD